MLHCCSVLLLTVCCNQVTKVLPLPRLGLCVPCTELQPAALSTCSGDKTEAIERKLELLEREEEMIKEEEAVRSRGRGG